MEDRSPNAFANREEALPILSFANDDNLSDRDDVSAEENGQPEKSRNPLSRTNIKETLQKVTGQKSAGLSMQDRLLDKLLQQIIPDEDLASSREGTNVEQSYVQRPSFNITTMSNNFRRFNSRIGVVFVFQAKILRLMSWRNWSHTMSFLAVYTFICLDPYLLAVLPLLVLLLAVLIPAFMIRHPAPPKTLSSYPLEYTASGPPIAPAPTVKPVKELSKDFFRNMRDLQNSMEDFSRVHDQVLSIVTPTTNFSNEPLSSTVVLLLCAATAILSIASRFLPWRLLFLVTGWSITCANHPALQRALHTTYVDDVAPRETQARTYLDRWVSRDIILDSEAETREVEIFELQRRSHQQASEWEAWLFAPAPHEPLSAARIADERPRGARFFEDVQPPRGWAWSEKKWALDLWSREWVEERMITGVELEMEGERWVYDLEYVNGGGSGSGAGAESPDRSAGAKGKMTATATATVTATARMTDVGEDERRGKRGEWRRRRWVRMVKRRNLHRETTRD